MKVLQPLIERIEVDVMASDVLHADDTPIRVLDKSLRDQRPCAGASPLGAVYAFAPDWKEEHLHRHLSKTRGILQADACKGYAKLYTPDPDGTPRLAHCIGRARPETVFKQRQAFGYVPFQNGLNRRVEFSRSAHRKSQIFSTGL